MIPTTWPKIIAASGLLLFLISFLFPAYMVSRKIFYGYQCAYISPALAVSGDIEGGIATHLLTRFHFFLLGLHNGILPICLLMSNKIINGKHTWVLNLFVISTLNTILFFFYNHFMVSKTNEDLQIGYYLWVLSSIIILIHLIWQKRVE